MKYENQELIDKIEKVAEEILKAKYSNCYRDKFFPMIIEKLGFKVGVEIGVDKASFSNHVLSKTNIDMYYCIDTWQDDFGSDYRPEFFNKDGDIRFNEAYNTIKEYVDSKRAVLIKSTGLEASKDFGTETIDFCYIDGDHSLGGIYTDIVAWTPKVKIGGIISGHDYKDGGKSGINDYFGKQLDYKIKTVVDYYCQRYGYKLNEVGSRIKSWWFVKNKKAEDRLGDFINE